VLLFDGVALDEGDDHVGGEGCFGEVETVGHVADGDDDCFVRFLGLGGGGHGARVGCFDQELPGGVYVGLVAVVGAFVDGDADVEVAGWIGVCVVKLEFICQL
jgi:hypothetical protein